ncbi:hypothetical protein ACQ4PT_007655 [Festuca glaucescens]
MGERGESSATSKGVKDMVEELLGGLNLHEEGEDDFFCKEEITDPPEKAKWLVIGKVYTPRGFSPTALYAYMRSAWNLVKEVIWRKLEDNLFTIQFGCLGDWSKAMNMGPWLFRNNYVLILEEYDGFMNPRSVALDKIISWVRVLTLPDNYPAEHVIKGICRPIGEIKEVKIKLPTCFIGEFVRVRVGLDVSKKLHRFVSITKDKKERMKAMKPQSSTSQGSAPWDTPFNRALNKVLGKDVSKKPATGRVVGAGKGARWHYY